MILFCHTDLKTMFFLAHLHSDENNIGIPDQNDE